LSKLSNHDLGSYYVSLLIPLAKRFNNAYYLFLNTGKASGVESRKSVDVESSSGKVPNSRAPEVHTAVSLCGREPRSFFLFVKGLELFFCRISATKQFSRLL
jgi:hypothetical protein